MAGGLRVFLLEEGQDPSRSLRVSGWVVLSPISRLQLLSVKSGSGKRRRRETDYVRAVLPLSHQPGRGPATLLPALGCPALAVSHPPGDAGLLKT